MPSIIVWVVVGLVFFIFLRVLLRIFLGKKIQQQAGAQNEALKRQTQGRLGRDAETEKQVVQQLQRTKDSKRRKELLKQAGKIAKDEEVVAKRGA